MKIDLTKDYYDYSDDLREINENDGRIHLGNHTAKVTLDGGLELDVDVDIDVNYSTAIEKDERGNISHWFVANKEAYVLFNEAFLGDETFALEGSTITQIENAIEKEVENAQ